MHTYVALAYAPAMPEVVISFLDGELLYAEIPELTFDLPIIEAEVRNVDPNSERALFPLTAIRQLIVGERTPAPAPAPAEVDTWDKAAFHFLDGEVLRASIRPDAYLGRHGGIWGVVEANGNELRILAIPYTSLKGVYQLRQWDGRPPGERPGALGSVEKLARVLAEREVAQESSLPRASKPLLTKVRRKQRGG